MRKQTEPIVEGLGMVRGDVVPPVRREDEEADRARVPEDVRQADRARRGERGDLGPEGVEAVLDPPGDR